MLMSERRKKELLRRAAAKGAIAADYLAGAKCGAPPDLIEGWGKRARELAVEAAHYYNRATAPAPVCKMCGWPVARDERGKARRVLISGPEVLYCAQCRGGMIDTLISEARALPDAELYARFHAALQNRGKANGTER